MEKVKSGPKPKISAKEQLFMYLSCLKIGSLCHMYPFCFKPQKATILRHFVNWKSFSSFSLGSIPIWATSEQIQEQKSKIFKRT